MMFRAQPVATNTGRAGQRPEAMPRCPLCTGVEVSFHAHARDIEYKTIDRYFEFYHCANCDVLFIDPMLSDRLSELYPANYYSFVVGRRSIAVAVKEQLDLRFFRRALRTVLGDELSALDVGGGTGWLLDIVKRADLRVKQTWVVDVDPQAQKVAEEQGHRYFLGPIDDFSHDEKFDIVLMLNLIEHVSNPRAVLRKAHDLLLHSGRLFIKTPNFNSLDARLFRHQSWGGYHTPRHFVLFNRESLARLCNDCGFDIEHFSYTQGAPFWSVSALDMLHRIGLVNISQAHPAIYHPLMPLLQIGFGCFDFVRRPFAKLSQMQLILRPKV
jgi:2-polyprenyl-3-methyl-5-hydroxy-6-metoxy-1,4-benzoquinol methylase